MHDIVEGISHSNICHIIQYMLNMKLFSDLQAFDDRVNSFNYGDIEIGNIALSPITLII